MNSKRHLFGHVTIEISHDEDWQTVERVLDAPCLLTLEQVTRVLNCSKTAVLRLMRNGSLEGAMVRSMAFVTWRSVERWTQASDTSLD